MFLYCSRNSHGALVSALLFGVVVRLLFSMVVALCPESLAVLALDFRARIF